MSERYIGESPFDQPGIAHVGGDDCACDDRWDGDDRDSYDCTWCCGEGSFWGSELPGYDPGWHDPDTLYPCPACKGTGARKDQVLF